MVNEMSTNKRGNNWQGGKIKTQEGYSKIHSPYHPFKSNTDYVSEHRLVMEQWLRKNNPSNPALIEIDGEKYLPKNWIVHHKNEIRNDNRIENLELMTNGDHTRYHSSGEKNYLFGKHHSIESRKKMSLSRMGKHPSKETREKISLSKRGEKNPMYGKKPWLGRCHSDETKIKLSLIAQKQNQSRDEITGRFISKGGI